MNRSKLGVLTIITVFLLSFGIAVVAAQQAYQTAKTTNVTIPSDGTFYASEPGVGVSYQIQGVAGAKGTVTATVYNGNPEATANIPAGISLSHFIVIALNMNANDFQSATIVISYSDSDVQGISAPYAVYKWNADTNSFVAFPSSLYTSTKTIMVTITSISDPLFAIGGATATGNGIPASTWIIIAVSAIVIVLVAVFVVILMRKREGDSTSLFSFKPKENTSLCLF